jgi:hypothetical protein
MFLVKFNENGLAEMFSNNRMPCLTTVDLNTYHTHKKLGRDTLETKFTHRKSKVNHLVLPVHEVPSYMNFRLTLDLRFEYKHPDTSSKLPRDT